MNVSAADKIISKAKAKVITLEKTKVKKSSVKKWTQVKRNGAKWKLGFKTKYYKYYVELNARSGRVIIIEKDKISRNSEKYIGIAKAKSIALRHAKKNMGITGKVKYTKARFCKKRGKAYYEIDFSKDDPGYEYEYKINAKTGKIIDWVCMCKLPPIYD